MLHDVRTLYIIAILIGSFVAGTTIGMLGAPGWAAVAFMILLAVICIIAVLRNVKVDQGQ